MKRHISILAILLTLGVLATRAGVKNATMLCIENTTGETIQFPLIETPKMVFKGNYVVVQASTAKILKFKDVKQIYFTDDEVGVNSVENEEGINTEFNNVSLKNFKPGTTVRVYTTAGTIVKQAYTDADGSLNISTTDLRRGTYIIKAGKTAFKFTKL